MRLLVRLFRTRLAFRSAAVTLATVTALGVLSLAASGLVIEQREERKAQERLEALLDTVERTVQVACFLENRDLAQEVTAGLLSNRTIQGVTIRTDTAILATQNRSGAVPAEDLGEQVRPIHSPFNPAEQVCEIALTPNAEETQRAVMEASLFVTALLALQFFAIGVVVILVTLRLVTRPITRVSQRLYVLQAETGQKLETPTGNEQDEIGRLVASVNAMIDYLVSTLRKERDLRVAREVEERRFRTIFENVETGIFELDEHGRVLSANPAFKRMLHLPADVDPEQSPVRLNTLTDGATEQLEQLLTSLSEDAGPVQFEIRCCVGGRLRWINMILNRVGEDRLQGVANDVTERKLAAEAAEQMALTDPLTGLGNRRGLERRLAAAIDAYRSDPTYRCAMILLDLDQFKETNDVYGHAVGDHVLEYVGTILTDVLRSKDYVARLGGDEFVVLIEGAGTREDIAAVAERFLTRVNAPIMIEGDRRIHVGASLGIAVLGLDAETERELIMYADTAMYRAKHAGRNTYRFYSD